MSDSELAARFWDAKERMLTNPEPMRFFALSSDTRAAYVAGIKAVRAELAASAPRVAACLEEDECIVARQHADAVAKAAGFAWREETPAEHLCLCCGAEVGRCEHTRASTTFRVGAGQLDAFQVAPPKPAEEWPAAPFVALCECADESPIIAVGGLAKEAGPGWEVDGFYWSHGGGKWHSNRRWQTKFKIDAISPPGFRFTIQQWRSIPGDIDRQAPGIKRHEPLPRVATGMLNGWNIVTEAGECGAYNGYGFLGKEWHYYDSPTGVAGYDPAPGEPMPADAAAALRRDFPELAAHPNIAPDLPPKTEYRPWANAEEAWEDGLRPGVEVKLPDGFLLGVASMGNDHAISPGATYYSYAWLTQSGCTFAATGKPCGREVRR